MTIKLNEIFYSIQGEGRFTGCAAVFVRLAGCSMKCKFCDTDFSEKFSLTVEQIEERIRRYNCQHVVITGGEPLEQDINWLVCYLANRNYFVQIETNGSINKNLPAWFTISPKGNYRLFMLNKANEIKLVLHSGIKHPEMYISFMLSNSNCMIYLQPESNKKGSIQKCLKMIKHFNNARIRLGLQMHKILRIK